jgi:hypothetical protein
MGALGHRDTRRRGVLGVMIFGDFAERVPVSYTPALAVSWVMFLLLALTAMRFKSALVHLASC